MAKRTRIPAASANAAFVPLPCAPGVFGLSRSAIYREAAKENIRLVKLGRSTYVDSASMRAFLATLPVLTPKQAA